MVTGEKTIDLPRHDGWVVCFETMTLINEATEQAEYNMKRQNDIWYLRMVGDYHHFYPVTDEDWIRFLREHYNKYLIEKILLGDG